jgi:hypothetical protein
VAEDKNGELQDQALELLRAQHAAYLEFVKAWRQAMTANPPPSAWPAPPGFEGLPSAAEIAADSHAFAVKLLEEQKQFLEALSKLMAGEDGAG